MHVCTTWLLEGRVGGPLHSWGGSGSPGNGARGGTENFPWFASEVHGTVPVVSTKVLAGLALAASEKLVQEASQRSCKEQQGGSSVVSV